MIDTGKHHSGNGNNGFFLATPLGQTLIFYRKVGLFFAFDSGKGALDELVDKSINQTLSRSIFTSVTTFVMVAALYVLGVTSIKEFALPLMVGIVCGTYSSVCLTGAMWYVFKTKMVKKED